MGRTTDIIGGNAYITISGHSAGGAGYLTRILHVIDKEKPLRIIVLVEAGEYQEQVLTKIGTDLRLYERVSKDTIPVKLMRVNDYSMNDEYDWRDL